MGSGYIHRIRVGGVASLAITMDHLRQQRIWSLSAEWDNVGKCWYLDIHHEMKDIEWALEGLRPNILPPK